MEELRARVRVLHEEDRREWAQHWPRMLARFVIDVGGGFAFGVAFGLSAVLWGLAEAMKL